MRAALLALLAGVAVGCGSANSTPTCMILGSPGPLVTSAMAFRFDVYGPETHCAGAMVVAGARAPLESRTFVRGEPITLQVPPGAHTMVVTTFADAAATTPLGHGCLETDVSAGAHVCFSLTISGVRDLGGSASDLGSSGPRDLAGDAAPTATTIWTRAATSGPSSRHSSRMAYDSGRDRMVMFGGASSSSGSLQGGTYEWDGTSWTQRSSTNSPSNRGGYGIAYDSARGVTVLFGGSLNSGISNETWEWNGSGWTQRSPATNPQTRCSVAMVYDPDRHVCVMFGGSGSTTNYQDTWQYDGTNWAKLSPATVPPARAGAAMAYDAARHVVVLFGGSGSKGSLDDTWEFDGTNWTQRTATTAPAPRRAPAMAYDSVRHVTVLFGGTDNTSTWQDFGDTWEWDGTAWTQRSTMGPTARRSAAMAFDPQRGHLVLFGGSAGSKYSGASGFADTWVY